MNVFAPLLGLTLLLAPTLDVEITAEPHHHLVMANERVRVLNVEVPPGEATLMHWHRHDYVYVTLGAVELSNVVEGQAPADLKLQDGEVRFSPGPFAHSVRDLSNQPFRNVTIEFLQDQKLRRTPSHWDEDRGLNVLQGGTQEILFVKDAVRVAHFELQPGGVIPEREHGGAVLLVAVSDLDLRGEENEKPATIRMRAGESKWLPTAFAHPLKSASNQAINFVTLEFP